MLFKPAKGKKSASPTLVFHEYSCKIFEFIWSLQKTCTIWLALHVNTWFIFEVTCSQVKICLIVFYPLVSNIEIMVKRWTLARKAVICAHDMGHFTESTMVLSMVHEQQRGLNWKSPLFAINNSTEYISSNSHLIIFFFSS